MRLAALPALVAGAARAQVEAACHAPATARAGKGEALIEVAPFGPGSHGVAPVAPTTPGGTGRVACALDKRARPAEITAPFASPPEG